MFMPRFATAVVSGAKCRTIRPTRKVPIVVGDRLSLRQWSAKAYRSPQLRLREATCIGVDQVELKMGRWFTRGALKPMLIIAGQRYMAEHAIAQQFARADGFADFGDMVEWFDRQHGLPFKGILIRWGP